MLGVFICEDNEVQRNQIESFIRKYLLIEELDMEIRVSTGDPKRIIDYLERHPDSRGIYFLDVDLKCEMNGIELGAKIREKDIHGKIIFITTHDELLSLTFKYKVEAMDYILKEGEITDVRERIQEALDQAQRHFLKEAQKADDFIQLKIGSQIRILDLQQVMFFETASTPHKLILHLANSTLEFYGKINDIAELSPLLVRIHKSYVINYKNIQLIDKKKREVTMTNGEKCFLSIRLIKQLESAIKTK
ncbi:LytTR family DNA-binding domain-containing protein [Enterococcus sp.]|uniref:LytR/AlgR family response regulator transcription factor n=1 Tax=Enterococcus sp. TaxID=35783 RepID=UPI00290677E7|nr:LytTR family DNA-binding domain-containing protein [Enterococcus sp.]MDU5337087.1 LytTR family DNA-binding domain-containing protein [Enterococcus sp.]